VRYKAAIVSARTWTVVPRGGSGVTVRLMSDGELTRLEVLRDLDQRRLTTEAAAQLLRHEVTSGGPALEGLPH
jgi:hypothetical protein